MDSEEGWEDVDKTFLNIDIKEKIKKLDIKINFIQKLTSIFKMIKEPINIPIIDEFIDINVLNKLEELCKTKDQIESNIKFFKCLTHYNIYSRLYITFKSSFLEITVNDIIIKHSNKYIGPVFYIDSLYNIEDYSWYFSKDMKNYKIFFDVFKLFKKYISNIIFNNYNTNTIFENNISINKKLDNLRIKQIPTNTNKFIHHPLFCLESLLNNKQKLSKRNIQGYFKGEPVFLKSDIKSYKSLKYYYKNGFEPIDKSDTSDLYSQDQVKPIVISDMNDKLIQDYLHPSHVPKNCIYINNEYVEHVCKKLKINYRLCFVGFNKMNPIYRGVFIYKKDLFLVSNFLFEMFDYNKKLEIIQKYNKINKNWKLLVKMCNRYKKLQSKFC